MTERVRVGGLTAPRRPLFTLLAALLLSGCHTAPPIIVPPPPFVSPVDRLQRTIDKVLADPALARGTWGIAVRSLARDETLYAINARKLLMPASTMKLVTLATAADRLGWDYTYRTRLMTAGAIDGGVLHGDVLIVGSGDPTLDDWSGAATGLFDEWAGLLKQAGIVSITGGVVGDDNAFDDDGLGTGWAWDDLGASYATSVGALQFNENTAQIVVGPGSAAGDPASVEVKPPVALLSVRNLVTTGASGTSPSLVVRPVPHAPALEVRGVVPIGSARLVRNVSVPNPTLYFTNAVRDALVRNGLQIGGPAEDVDDLSEPPDRSSAVAVAESQTVLSAFAGTMMKLSQNLFAETLLRTLGAEASGTGSAEQGRAAIRSTLAEWGVAAEDLRMVDGSGLSRYNVITPDALVRVLVHVYKDDRLRDAFTGTLPSAGVDGTLANRMKGTAAAGNVRAKTGSFSNAQSLAGYVQTADGEPLAFAIIANNYGVEPNVIDNATDAIVVALASFSRR